MNNQPVSVFMRQSNAVMKCLMKIFMIFLLADEHVIVLFVCQSFKIDFVLP